MEWGHEGETLGRLLAREAISGSHFRGLMGSVIRGLMVI